MDIYLLASVAEWQLREWSGTCGPLRWLATRCAAAAVGEPCAGGVDGAHPEGRGDAHERA